MHPTTATARSTRTAATGPCRLEHVSRCTPGTVRWVTVPAAGLPEAETVGFCVCDRHRRLLEMTTTPLPLLRGTGDAA